MGEDDALTEDEMAGKLALMYANGMSFKDMLNMHTIMLVSIGRSYVDTWGCDPPMPHDQDLKDGAYYVLTHLRNPDEWGT